MKIYLSGFQGPWSQLHAIEYELKKKKLYTPSLEGADIIYCHGISGLFDVKRKGLFNKKKIVAKVLDIPKRDLGNELELIQYRALLQKSDLILTNTNFVSSQLKEWDILDSYVVGDPANLDWKMLDQDAIFDNSRKIDFISYGRVSHPLKRIRLAMKAFDELQLDDMQYHIFGPETIDHWHPDIYFNGYLTLTDLTKKLLEAKCTLAPSAFEGLGLCPIESVLCGSVPIVADIPVMKEVWGKTIPMFKVDDKEDFKRVIMSLIDKNFKWDLSKALIRARRYTPHRVANRILKRIEENI